MKFALILVTEAKIKKLLVGLSNTRSTGLDTILAAILKGRREVLAKPIAHTINRILMTGIYPNKWKLLLVIPLFKGKGD